MERMELIWGQQEQDPATGMGINSRLGGCSLWPVLLLPAPRPCCPPAWRGGSPSQRLPCPMVGTAMTTGAGSPWRGAGVAFLQPSDAAPGSTGMPEFPPEVPLRGAPTGLCRCRRGTPALCFAAQTHPWHLWDYKRCCSLGPPSGRRCLGPSGCVRVSWSHRRVLAVPVLSLTARQGWGWQGWHTDPGTHRIGRDREAGMGSGSGQVSLAHGRFLTP